MEEPSNTSETPKEETISVSENGQQEQEQPQSPERPSTPAGPGGTPMSPVPGGGGDALEERYNKLKAITLKYKKKLVDQTAEIERLQKFQNASKIQQEYDKALDEVEALKKSEKDLQKYLQQAVDENVKLKMKEADSAGQVQNLTASHKSLRDKLDVLEKEAQAAGELKAKVEELEKELEEGKEARVEAQNEKRQLQILSLEVTDYEKKLEDSTGSLAAKIVECDKLSGELAGRDQKVKELDLVIATLRESESKLLLTKESLQADNARKSEKIGFLQDEIGKLSERLNERKNEADRQIEELENCKHDLTSQCKDLSEKLGISQKSVVQLEQKVSLLEENKRNRETQITNLKLEMQQLESDYFSYKTKAQAMLKANNINKPIAAVDNDEIDRLQKAVQDLHSELAILRTDLQTTKLENENLTLERADTNLRMSQLRGDFAEKEVQLSADLQKLRNELREKEETFTKQLECKSVELEQLATASKNEILRLRKEYENQMNNLREQYELMKRDSDSPGENLLSIDTHAHLQQSSFRPIPSDTTTVVEEAQAVARPDGGRFHPISMPLTIDTGNKDLTFDQLRMIPRGEGEGSESVPSASASAYTPRVDNYNVSFEQLLSSSFDSVSKESDVDKIDYNRTLRESLQTELVRCQTQIAHLTSLLRESESNCDRLAQLSEALKEEIRRIERDKERQGHLKENTEYLKNVILKFVTLTGETERQRLIPVLKTMLRLTGEEVEKLEIIVKGKSSQDPISTGWSSYLPLWSGGGTGG